MASTQSNVDSRQRTTTSNAIQCNPTPVSALPPAPFPACRFAKIRTEQNTVLKRTSAKLHQK